MTAQLKLSQADIDYANSQVKDAPLAVARALIRRLEGEHRLKPGSVMSGLRTQPISKVRSEVIVELYKHFNLQGRQLSISTIAKILHLHASSVFTVLRRRGLK